MKTAIALLLAFVFLTAITVLIVASLKAVSDVYDIFKEIDDDRRPRP